MVEPDHLVFFLTFVQVCCVEFDRKDINMNKLVATSLEGKFHVFDMRTQHPTKGFASVSEKVIDLARVNWMDVTGRMFKGSFSYNFYISVVRRKTGSFSQLEAFWVVFV